MVKLPLSPMTKYSPGLTFPVMKKIFHPPFLTVAPTFSNRLWVESCYKLLHFTKVEKIWRKILKSESWSSFIKLWNTTLRSMHKILCILEYSTLVFFARVRNWARFNIVCGRLKVKKGLWPNAYYRLTILVMKKFFHPPFLTVAPTFSNRLWVESCYKLLQFTKSWKKF